MASRWEEIKKHPRAQRYNPTVDNPPATSLKQNQTDHSLNKCCSEDDFDNESESSSSNPHIVHNSVEDGKSGKNADLSSSENQNNKSISPPPIGGDSVYSDEKCSTGDIDTSVPQSSSAPNFENIASPPIGGDENLNKNKQTLLAD